MIVRASCDQFVPEARVDATIEGEGEIDWLDDHQIGAILPEMERDPAAWHPEGTGQFSLAGAQAKTALYRDPDTGRWGAPGAQPPRATS